MEKRTSKNTLLIVVGILIIAMIVVSVLKLDSSLYTSISRLIVLVPTALYVFWLYKIPHGNLLKYIIFVFLIINGLNILFLISVGANPYIEAIRLVCLGTICYCSGRLNRIIKNRVIFAFVTIVLFALNTTFAINNPEMDVLSIIWLYSMPIAFLAITLSYIARFNEHIEAGLIDAPKN